LTFVTLTLVRTGSFGDATITWTVQLQTASLTDIGQSSGTVTIPNGVDTASFQIPVVADDEPEVDETFSVSLLAVAETNQRISSTQVSPPSESTLWSILALCGMRPGTPLVGNYSSDHKRFPYFTLLIVYFHCNITVLSLYFLLLRQDHRAKGDPMLQPYFERHVQNMGRGREYKKCNQQLAVHTTSACGSLFVNCNSKFAALKSFRLVAIFHQTNNFIAGTTSCCSSHLCHHLAVFFACWNFSAVRALSAMKQKNTL